MEKRTSIVYTQLNSALPGMWRVYEDGQYNKLLIRLKDQLFLRERKYGRGIPKKYIENYFKTELPSLPRILGKITLL